jgi:hypothetical protein
MVDGGPFGFCPVGAQTTRRWRSVWRPPHRERWFMSAIAKLAMFQSYVNAVVGSLAIHIKKVEEEISFAVHFAPPRFTRWPTVVP